MTTKEKIKEVLSSRELMRVNSVQHRVSAAFKYILFALTAVLYIIGILFGFEILDRLAPLTPKLYYFLGITIMFGIINAVLVRSTSRGNPLIITERGIAIEPRIAELWEDIDQYGWESFRGGSRVSLTKDGEGTCLYIRNKGLWQRNIESWFAHSALSEYGAFFDKEQVKAAEDIFKAKGVSKIELGKETSEDNT